MLFDESKIEKALHNLPKTQVPLFDLSRVRNQIADRIALPETVESGWFSRLNAFVPYLRIGVGVMASLLIVVSLTLGTAVAALDSVPGSAIYPLKKVVENIQLRLTPSDQKTNLQLRFANNRIDELQQVIEQSQEGKISAEEASAIVANTVKDLQKTTAAVANSAKNNDKSTKVANKLADLSNKLLAASVQSEGQLKIELEKAIESTQISQEEAIKNLENAGLKIENSPIEIEDLVKASGKLTDVTEDSISIGSAKFLLTEETKYINFTEKDLKTGIIVDILAQIKDNKSYAVQIKLVSETMRTETIDTPVPDDTQQE